MHIYANDNMEWFPHHYYEQKYDDDLAFHYVSDWPPAKYDESRQAIAEQIIKLLEAGVTQ